MPLTKEIAFPLVASMNRAEVVGALNKWKWPVAGVAAAFVGSLYTLGFTQSFQLYAASDNDDKEAVGSYGVGGLLKKLIHDFMQNGNGPDKPPLSSGEASLIIRKNERRVDVNCGIVSFFDSNNMPSNNPMEDRNSECRILSTQGALFSIFDGHGGWQCAEALKKRLPLYIALALLKKSELTTFENEILEDLLVSRSWSVNNSSGLRKESSLNTGYSLSQKQEVFHTGPKYLVDNLKSKLNGDGLPVAESLSLAFTTLDDDIVAEAIPIKVLDDAFVTGASGACALTAYVTGDQLYVANAGDCRAVLGSESPEGKWSAMPLSVDQTADNEGECRRLWSEHPGEQGTVIKNGRLLGQLQPLRAFGDIQYKWDQVTHSHILTQVYGGPIVPPSLYKSPPYLTAKPVITQRRIRKQDKFLILATDGLWDTMSSEKAVELVGQFVKGMNEKQSSSLEHNAASHLIRNALGGNDHHFVAQMLLVPDQYRRMWRDDVTVTVIFFNSDDVHSVSHL